MSKIIKDNFFRIKSQLQPKKGRLLVAEPFLNGDVFERAVVLIVDYNDEGVVGLILNKPLDMDVEAVDGEIEQLESRFYLGGPVETDYLYCLHSYGKLLEDSETIDENLYWGGDLEQINDFVHDKLIDPNQILLFLGYAGWSKEQLATEIDQRNWIVLDHDLSIVLNPPSDQDLWEFLVQGLGDKFRTWKDLPDHPALN